MILLPLHKNITVNLNFHTTLLFPWPAEVHFCCSDDGRFGNRGQGQICKKSPNHQTLFRSADNTGAETAGETCSWVSIEIYLRGPIMYELLLTKEL